MDESNHFIEYLNINNYKCFNDFSADGFKRVNLIGGKANVGKTVFIEAMHINVHSKTLSDFCFAMIAIKIRRESLNILQDFLHHNIQYDFYKVKESYLEKNNGIDIRSNKNKTSFDIEEKEGIKEYHFKYGGQETKVNTADFSVLCSHDDNIYYIDNFGLTNQDIVQNYSFIQRKEKEAYLNCLLKRFDTQIKSFAIINDKPQCKINGEYRDITELGDEIRSLISIVVSLFRTENGHLFIDEIDNGIHYTHLDKLWEVIMKLSSDLNVQLFATTHSKECIESYVRVNESMFKNDITFTALRRLKDDSIKAIVIDYEELTGSIKEDRELR